jgi:hypothetical protein
MNKILFGILILTFGGCTSEKDPYPETKNVQRKPQEEERPVRTPLSMDIPASINFVENQKKATQFRFSVPVGSKPVIEIKDLPRGATFDESTFTLNWTPDFLAANDPTDPTVLSRIYTITVWLRDSQNPVTAIMKKVNLIVKDSPRDFTVDVAKEIKVNEGEELKASFKINSVDHPQGPFKINYEGLPNGAKVSVDPQDSSRFQISYRPSHDTVILGSGSGSCGYYTNCVKNKIKMEVINPGNYQTTHNFDLVVYDTRLPVKFSAPEKIEQGLDVLFQISATDPNFDVIPKINVLNKPDFGSFSTKIYTKDESKTGIFEIRWTDIPLTRLGSLYDLKIEACVYNENRSFFNCKTQTVQVSFITHIHFPPRIDRGQWPIGKIKYLKYNEEFKFNLKIKDQENANRTPSVVILPREMNKNVQWQRDNLTMKFDKPGLYQFNVVATSEYNVQTAESFVVEVFEENRSDILLLTDSIKNDEIKFYQGFFKQIDLLNPGIHKLDERNLVHRKTIILTSSLLMDREDESAIEEAFKLIPNIIVATPKILNLPQSFINNLIDDYGVSFLGPISNLPGDNTLANLVFDYQRSLGLQQPKGPIKLKGSTTQASQDPFIFSVGVASSCQAFLELHHMIPINRYQTAIMCKRKTSGKVILTGFEWADMLVGSNDQDLPYQWLGTILKMEL